MNANELADKLESFWLTKNDDLLIETVTMLRQQQAEIEALKQIIDANNLSQNIGQFVKPANEPVAWINLDRFKDEALYLADCVSENKVDNMGITTPLYTYPAKTLTEDTEDTECQYCKQGCIRCDARKLLTDEEIMVLYEEYIETQYASESNVLGFGRAILRKAQEK